MKTRKKKNCPSMTAKRGTIEKEGKYSLSKGEKESVKEWGPAKMDGDKKKKKKTENSQKSRAIRQKVKTPVKNLLYLRGAGNVVQRRETAPEGKQKIGKRKGEREVPLPIKSERAGVFEKGKKQKGRSPHPQGVGRVKIGTRRVNVENGVEPGVSVHGE